MKSPQQAGLLVDDLLTFSKLMGRWNLDVYPVDVDKLIEESRQALSRNPRSVQKITWRVSRLPIMQGDAMMLR